jgi:hypothetical protein
VEGRDADELDGTATVSHVESRDLEEADLETEESSVVAIMIPKYPLVTWPVGNPQTTKVATVAMVKRAQKAHNQGLNTWLDC